MNDPLGLDHFFRRQYGRVVAGLVAALGREHLDLAEDAVQEALLRALRTWPLQGIPSDPAAWVLTVARRAAIDRLRQQKLARDHQEGLVQRLEDRERAPTVDRGEVDDENLGDDVLRMMFLCGSPEFSAPTRVALMLNLVSGFSAAEIGRAFLASEQAVAQRLVRAKRDLRESTVPLAIRRGTDIAERLPSVVDAIYLVFNEGYTPRDGEVTLRSDLVREALRLSAMLVESDLAGEPLVHALRALLLFQSSRQDSRIVDGALCTLAEQDRGRWDRSAITLGLRHLGQAAHGEALSEMHILAGIAACHAAAPSFAETDWARIASLYDELARRNASPLIALNRAVAHSFADGAFAGLAALDRLAATKPLSTSHLFAAARADCLVRLGNRDQARAAYELAATQAPTNIERRFLENAARGLGGAGITIDG